VVAPTSDALPVGIGADWGEDAQAAFSTWPA
jgi:hypothetical protein